MTLRTDCRGDGFTSIITVISADEPGKEEDVSAVKIPVRSNFKNTVFPDKVIEAVNLTKDGRKFTVVVTHQEYASPTDTFFADGCTGFGNVVVFDRSIGETQIGTVLAD